MVGITFAHVQVLVGLESPDVIFHAEKNIIFEMFSSFPKT